ncbi:hypothetical protein J31TS4_35350 [Paenibacillus sp. J31TS4]|uniref:M50 family metallopeptidase n=1 Tax=Paenibacillus sp. J31TS4 TaxID=2807195 RepID=UPI001B186041|nr:M50 family metallopeptidase [Paenibacillus sp. J31TS4]GIP40255.1 hypothetical protein J31TS4_35350 [Paenibacillus sp. J31TS4]
MGKWMMTILFLIVSAFLTRVLPFSDYFRNVDTMIHEFGHAVVTLLLSGKVYSISLFSDHSGVTQSAITRGWALIPVGLAGYMTASLTAWLLFRLDAKGREGMGMKAVLLVAIVSLLLFVRNQFGVLWLLGFIVLTALILLFAGRTVGRIYYLIVAFLTLEESVMGPFSLVLYALENPAQAGDATLLAIHSPLPAVVWALLLTLFALWCATKALAAFLASSKSRPGRGAGQSSGMRLRGERF